MDKQAWINKIKEVERALDYHYEKVREHKDGIKHSTQRIKELQSIKNAGYKALKIRG